MNIIRLTGEVGWDILATSVSEKFSMMSGDVVVHVDSVGGDVFEGSAIYQTIKGYKGGKVTAIIGSLAASAASYFILAADEIHAYENSTYMIHEARASIWGATAKELQSKLNAVDGINKLYVQAYQKKTGKTEEDVKELMDAETYFFGSEILEHGFVDKLLTDEEMSAKVENTLEYSKNRLVACANNCKSRPVNAKPLSASVKVNPLLLEANKIMEQIK